MSLSNSPSAFRPELRQLLLKAARDSIELGLRTGRPTEIRLENCPAELRQKRAVFITLNVDGELRGCLGSIKAHRPLIEDVVQNAFAAAFMDSRFPRLEAGELEDLEIHISVLSELEPLTVSSEADAIAQLRVGIDGLMIEEGSMRGTYLPSMWESVPEPGEFLNGVKIKAGLPGRYWSQSLKLWRFTTESF